MNLQILILEAAKDSDFNKYGIPILAFFLFGGLAVYFYLRFKQNSMYYSENTNSTQTSTSDNSSKSEFTGKKPLPKIDGAPGIGERIDIYLLRQLNANPDFYAVEVVDECVKTVGKVHVTRFQLPGLMFGSDVDLALTVKWENYDFEFKKKNGKWSIR